MVRTKVAAPPQRFKLESPLGAGGHGEVWLGYDNLLRRRVAMKRLHGDSGIGDDALRHEAQLLARLSHPNIVAIYDLAEVDGETYLVLERVEGRSLRELLADGPLSEAEVTAIGMQTASALASAHASGVIHNDVKPENILIDSAGNARLTDFGISRFDGNTMTPTEAKQLFGTLAYIAPEVLQGSEPTPASDVYALGVSLREAASGEPTRAAGALTRQPAQTRDLRKLRALSPAFGAVLARATQSDPSQRFRTAEELAAALEAAGRVRTVELPVAPAADARPRVREATARPAPAVIARPARSRPLVRPAVVGAGLVLAGVALLAMAARLGSAGGGADPTPTVAAAIASPTAAEAEAPAPTATLPPATVAPAKPLQPTPKPQPTKAPPGKKNH